jgi:hypothetical protein
MSPASSEYDIKEGRAATSIPSESKITERRRAIGTFGDMPPTVRPAPMNPGASLEGARSSGKGERKEEGM